MIADNRVLVTGVSRRAGIAAAVAGRLSADGAAVFTTGWPAYDDELPWGRDRDQPIHLAADLSLPEAPAEIVAAAEAAIGPLTGLVAVHTVDTGGGLMDVTAELVDRHLAVNVRGTLLLMREFAARYRGESGSGRIVLFTSRPPQLGAIAYAAGKGAIEWITQCAATELGPRGITVNAVNPGPNQTGWMSEQVERETTRRTPLGRPGRPADAAALVSFLLSADAGWITGQSISSDGGHSIAHAPLPGLA